MKTFKKTINFILYTHYYLLFNNLIYYIKRRFNEVLIYISKENIIPFFFILKFNSLLQFKSLVEFTCLDFISKKKRFFLKYMLLSYKYNLRFTITTKINELSFIYSIKHIYYSASNLEREV